jgi:hypothetical protein
MSYPLPIAIGRGVSKRSAFKSTGHMRFPPRGGEGWGLANYATRGRCPHRPSSPSLFPNPKLSLNQPEHIPDPNLKPKVL